MDRVIKFVKNGGGKGVKARVKVCFSSDADLIERR